MTSLQPPTNQQLAKFDLRERRAAADLSANQTAEHFSQKNAPIGEWLRAYDNSGSLPKLIARSTDRGKMELHQSDIWRRILTIAG